MAAQPLGPSERVDAIDVVRGLALFGVLAINLVTEFRVSIFAQFLPKYDNPPALDGAVEAFLTFAVESKAFALFSLLFGIGLAVQFDRLSWRPERTVLLLRRLLILLAIGLAHLFLIWNGDILTEYALAGFVVLPFLFGSRALLAAGGLLCLALYLTMQWLPPVSLPDAHRMAQLVADAGRAYGTGGFFDILMFRVYEIPAILPLHVLVFPRTVSLFLFGAFIWRTGVLSRASDNRALLISVGLLGTAAGFGLISATDGYFLSGWPLLRRRLSTVGAAAPVLLALGYGAGVIAFMGVSFGRRLLAWAAPLGRMAFTNYLAQSIILGWVFYGYGLGLFGRVGAAAALLIGVILYAAQAVFSTLWLRHYRYGPVEWLWRRLMYGAPQAMSPAAPEA